MKFGEMPYCRVTYEEIERRCRGLIDKLKAAESCDEAMEAVRGSYALQSDMTPMEICYERHNMNVNDEFYAAEQAYYDEIGPKVTELFSEFDGLVLDSPFRAELEKTLGTQAFRILENGQRSFDSRLVPLLREENVLTERYNKVMSNIYADWKGKKVKTSAMAASHSSLSSIKSINSAVSADMAWYISRVFPRQYSVPPSGTGLPSLK